MQLCLLFIYPDRPESWQPGGLSALSLAVCSVPVQTGSWESHQSDHRCSMLKKGSSERHTQKCKERSLCWWKKLNWYSINRNVTQLRKCDEIGDMQTATELPSLSLCCFEQRLWWWVMPISQYKSYFPLENWMPLKTNSLFQRSCAAFK